MAKRNPLGHIKVTQVDGTSWCGLQAADGSFNVFDTVHETVPVGRYHKCGALNITSVDGTSFVGGRAKNGSLNGIATDGSTTGAYHPSGAQWMDGLLGSPFGDLLLEDGGYFLLEDGGFILLE